MHFYEAIKNRRSIYNISKNMIVPRERIEELVKNAFKYVPSAFNVQCSRSVLLFNEHHDHLWDVLKDSLKKIVPSEKFQQTEDKINSFKAGYGTVLFFEDEEETASLQKQFASYAEHFPSWSTQSIGMLQFIIWNLFEIEGLGASLQHYNVFLEAYLQEKYTLPKSWKLVSQMPFGKMIAPADEKTFNFSDDYLRIIT